MNSELSARSEIYQRRNLNVVRLMNVPGDGAVTKRYRQNISYLPGITE